MTIFQSEEEMQQWLSGELKSAEGLAELISNVDEIGELDSEHAGERKIIESYKTCINSLYINHVLSENENISLKDNESLKPDFLLYAIETQSVVIVELKNIAKPTRQAGTELGAYSGELRTWVPFLADGDIVCVVISMEWPTLLKHYVRHEIFWQNRNLICLRPVKNQNKIELESVPPGDIAEDPFSFKMSERHFGGYQICLYDNNLYSKTADRSRLDAHLEQMKSTLRAMSTEGNKLKCHGFAFLWKDTAWLAPYSITVANAAPFQSVERFLHMGSFEPSDIMSRFFGLVREFNPEGHSASLDKITEVCRRMLQRVCAVRPEGFLPWGDLSEIMGQRATLQAFVGWGMFGELFSSMLEREYANGNIGCSDLSPEIGMRVVKEIIDESYDFIDLSYLERT